MGVEPPPSVAVHSLANVRADDVCESSGLFRESLLFNRRSMPKLARAAFALSAALSVLVVADLARASCNQIPGTTNTFRGDRGSVDRPFTRPGDFVELRLSPYCDAASPGFGTAATDDV